MDRGVLERLRVPRVSQGTEPSGLDGTLDGCRGDNAWREGEGGGEGDVSIH